MDVQIDLEEPSVANTLNVLKGSGLTLDVLLQLSDTDIERLAPRLIGEVESVFLKVALRKKKEEDDKKREAERIAERTQIRYKRFVPYVGRVEATFEDGSTQFGSCVLVWKGGYALTALHIVERKEAETGKGNELAGRRSKRKISTSLSKILVILPNASPKPFKYVAILVQSSPDDDLALLRASRPLPEKFTEIEYLSSWLRYHPSIGDSVMVLSFPTGMGEERRISDNPSTCEDLPWMSEGTISCVDGVKGQAVALYSTFGGASGALVVHATREGGYRYAIHMGTSHESVELRAWGKAELGKEKAFTDYFTLRAPDLLDAHFRPGMSAGVVSPTCLHPQVVVKRKEKKEKTQDEQVEELDLFGAWPDLDDINDVQD